MCRIVIIIFLSLGMMVEEPVFVNHKEDDVYFLVIVVFILSYLVAIFSNLDDGTAAHVSVVII
jgi:hypothetical protein